MWREEKKSNHDKLLKSEKFTSLPFRGVRAYVRRVLCSHRHRHTTRTTIVLPLLVRIIYEQTNNTIAILQLLPCFVSQIGGGNDEYDCDDDGGDRTSTEFFGPSADVPSSDQSA